MRAANSAQPGSVDVAIGVGRRGADPAFADLHLLDPLSPDRLDDPGLFTTAKGLLRIATAAADAATRFAASGTEDPVSWMIRPSPLFAGRSALEACLEREGFEAATLCNGLLLGPGVDAARLSMLLAAMRAGEAVGTALAVTTSAATSGAPRPEGRPLRLFTCLVEGALGRGGARLQAFCAMTARAEDEVRKRLGKRYGQRLAKSAAVSEGFDDRSLLATVLLSEPIARMLAGVAGDASQGEGLDVAVEQRFTA